MTHESKLSPILTNVKRFLSKYNINVPFFIAGGSVFSSLNGSKFNDIDVYFYRKEDFDIVKQSFIATNNYETKNAITINQHQHDIQFICLNFGTPQQLFDTFDLNCSKVAIDSNGQIHIDSSCSKNITIDFKNIKTNTIKRYLKYIENKKAIDNDYNQLQKAIKYLIENKDRLFESAYDTDNKEITALQILRSSLYSLETFNKREILEYTQNTICKEYFGQTRLDIFEYISGVFKYFSFERCEELQLFEILDKMQDGFSRYSDGQFTKEDEKLKLKYAEYFI